LQGFTTIVKLALIKNNPNKHMSKTIKTTKAPKEQINDDIELKIAGFNMTIEEMKKWLEDIQKFTYEDHKAAEAKNKPSCAAALYEDWVAKSEEENVAASQRNVTFVPGKNTEDTKVFVSTSLGKMVEIKNVVRAKLDYNPELGFPILQLEIMNPDIKAVV